MFETCLIYKKTNKCCWLLTTFIIILPRNIQDWLWTLNQVYIVQRSDSLDFLLTRQTAARHLIPVMLFAPADIPLMWRRTTDLKCGARVWEALDLLMYLIAYSDIISHIDHHLFKCLLAHEQQLHQVDIFIGSCKEMEFYLLKQIQGDIVGLQHLLLNTRAM